MLGPFATASRRTLPVLYCHSPGVATVAHCLRIDVHNNIDNNDNEWQTGPLWPHKMGPITDKQVDCLMSPVVLKDKKWSDNSPMTKYTQTNRNCFCSSCLTMQIICDFSINKYQTNKYFSITFFESYTIVAALSCEYGNFISTRFHKLV